MFYKKIINLVKSSLNIVKVIDKSYSKLLFVYILAFIIFLADILSIGLVFPIIISLLDLDLLKRVIIENFLILSFILDYQHIHIIFFFLLLILSFIFFKFLLTVFITYKISMYFGKLQSNLELYLFDKFINQDIFFFIKNPSGNLFNYVKLETERSILAIKNLVNLMVETFATIIIIFLLIIFLGYDILYFLFFFFLASVLFIYSLKKYNLSYGSVRSKKYNSVLKIINETFYGIKDVIINNLQKLLNKQFNNENSILCKQDANYVFLVSLPRIFFEFILILSFIFIVFILLKGKFEVSFIVIKLSFFGLAAYRLFPAISRINVSIQSIIFRANSIFLVSNFLSSFKVNNLRNNNFIILSLNNHKIALKLKKIYFNYENKIISNHKKKIKNQFILKIKELNIYHKEKILIFGESGTGKSTLASILMGLIRAKSGQVIINKEIFKNISEFKKSISYVSHSNILFNDNLVNNITLKLGAGISDYSVKEIHLVKNILKKVNLNEDQIFEKNVGELGSKFSSGQKQKILISRLFYQKPKFIVMDEPTSFLDEKNDNLIMNEILNYFYNCNIVLISHKLIHKKYFSRIINIKNGEIFDE
jgi:ABC-type branched-subunit amino acid transport system ATPase component